MWNLLFWFNLLAIILNIGNGEQPAPNIVFVMFDDLGWMDVSYNGGQIPTKNIDNLFKESINLQRHYIHLICSVSRSQFLTGRYSMYSGFGKMSPFGVGHLGGIPNGSPTLPQWLKAYNAKITTYGVGKWHLGYATPSLLPGSKGFDHFFGFFQGTISYETAKIVANKCDGCNGDRYDMHDDGKDYGKVDTIENTMYVYRDKILQDIQIESDKAGNNPFYMYLSLQTPHGPLSQIQSYKEQCEELVGSTDEEFLGHRTKYCEAMLISDDVIGSIINKLKETDQWENTLFILTTDNGGDIENTGCNYPLRGTKGTLFEGNQRVITLVGGGIIPKGQYETKRFSLFSALDWTPTLLQFAGIYGQIKDDDKTWDGINQYNLIMYGDDYTDRIDRDHIVFNIGLRNLDSATVVFKYGDDNLFKYIAQDDKIEKAQFRRLDGWCLPDKDTGNWGILVNDVSNPAVAESTQPFNDKFVFDIIADVSELNNLLIANPDNKYDVDSIVSYALALFKPYVEHPLFSENIGGLWTYLEEEDRTFNNEIFIHPFLSQKEYIALVQEFMDKEEKHNNPISAELRTLYTEKWISPLVRDQVQVPTSCIGLNDGEYLIKLIDDDKYPLVSTKCSNGYMLIDVKKDKEWIKYFTSWSEWHYDIAGPDKNDRVNWNEWFCPSADSEYIEAYTDLKGYNYGKKDKEWTKYLISPECDICDINDNYHQQYTDKTSYYMNAAAYGVFFGVRRPACDFDWDSLQCKQCVHSDTGNMVGIDRSYDLSFEDKGVQRIMIGVCLTEVRSAFQQIAKDFEDFTGYGPMNYKPSVGMNGRFCQCAQTPKTNKKYIAVTKQEYTHKLQQLDASDIKLPDRNDHINVYYLHKEDFEIGTYRIRKAGTYILMDDISINFNQPQYLDVNDIDSPNDPTQDWWWPPVDSEDYPGSGYKAREQYMLGYFAGITIETHDVILDLNSHTIEQSLEFFHQQPFFAVIELMSQPFLPNQGPGFFGADPQFAENVIIKNGVIGRSSHHGIHGTKNKNIRIENVKIRNFMTHGIQMNGYEGLHIENVDVGPTTNEAFLNHNYAHLRMMLPYLYKMANWDEQHQQQTIYFDPIKRNDNGKKYTLNDLIDIAVPKLDKVFKYVMSPDVNQENLQKLMETDEDFELFINADGLPYGSVIYGVYLNYPGSGIFGWDVSDLRSSDLYIKDLTIHDLSHAGKEVFGLSKNKKRFLVNTLLAPLNLEHMFGSKDLIKEWVYNSYHRDNGQVIEPHYVGNICTDIYMAMYKFGSDRFDEWWLGTPYVGLANARLIDWAQGNDLQCMSSATFGGDYFEPICAIDGMVHPGKGLIALKITNVDNVRFDGDIDIYNLFDNTGLAEEGICISRSNDETNSDTSKVVGSQQPPYQVEYSMNQIFGISAELSDIKILQNGNINVRNLKSLTGRVLGIASWFNTKFTFLSNTKVRINDIFAGINVEKAKYDYFSMPNHKSEACAFAIYDNKDTKGEINNNFNENNNNDNFKQFCIRGNCGCFGDDDQFTNIGEISFDLQCDGMDEIAFEDSKTLLFSMNSHGANLIITNRILWIGMGLVSVIMIILIRYSSNRSFKYIPIK